MADMTTHPAADLFPLMTDDELFALAADIKANGLLQPVTMLGDVVLDGRNRLRACALAGVTPATRQFTGDSPVAFVIAANIKRRHLNPGQLAALAVELEPMVAKEARKRQLVNLKRGDQSPVVAIPPQREPPPPPPRSAPPAAIPAPATTKPALVSPKSDEDMRQTYVCSCGEVFHLPVWHCPHCGAHEGVGAGECGHCHKAKERKQYHATLFVEDADGEFPAPRPPPPVTGKARDLAAAVVGASGRRVSDAKALKAADPAAFEAVKKGDLTLAKATKEVKKAAAVAQLTAVETLEAKAAAGVYDVLVIDPPWPMQKIERDCRPNQVEFDYPTMEESEIAALALPAAEDCHVWLWTTHRFLPMAFRLLDMWRLNYVCTFVWHKPGGFQPVGLPQFNCEFALYARRGSPVFVDTKALPTCFSADRAGHSVKPDEFYAMVARVTAGRRLDMFGRRKIEDFDAWGKEAPL